MLTCYVEPQECYWFHPNIQRFIKSDDDLRFALRGAAYHIGEQLRRKGIDPAKIQTPLMLTGATTYTRTAFTVDTTGTGKDAVNESRIVVDSSEGSMKVTLQGATDDTGATWVDVLGLDQQPITIEVSGSAIQSAIVAQRFPAYRYVLADVSACTASIYMVDSGPDEPMRYWALRNCLLPILDREATVQIVYDELGKLFTESMQSLALDYDVDGSGDVDEDERSTKLNTIWAKR